MKIVFLTLIFLVSFSANSSVTCSGKITEIVKWSDTENLSILIDGTKRYLKFIDTVEKSVLLAAYMAQKTVTVHLAQDSITSCVEGWPHYTVYSGYFKITD